MRLVIFGAVTMLLGGCALSGDDTTFSDSPRILRELRVELRHPTPLFPSDRPAMYGRHRVSIEPGTEEMNGRLTFWHHTPDGMQFDVVAVRDTEALGLEARYLTDADFEDATATLVFADVEYTGTVTRMDLDIDLLYGIVYGTMSIRFVPEGGGESLDFGADLAGYIDSYCSRDDGSKPIPSAQMHVTPGEPLPTPQEDDPAACLALFEALRATPDDPNGPPPPYSLDDTPSGGPASTPAADAG